MRILKYLLILFIFCCVSFVIFLATSSGYFEYTQSKETTLAKNEIFAYISNPENFKSWSTFIPNQTQFNIKKQKNNNEFFFEIETNGKKTYHKITFDTIPNEGIILSMHTSGKLNFIEKVERLYKPIEEILSPAYSNILNNINFNLTKKQNDFKIEPTKEVYFDEKSYVSLQDTSSLEKLPYILKQHQDSLYNLAPITSKNNEIQILWLPKPNDTQDEFIFIIENEETPTKKLPAFKALKTTLIGDFSHIKTAIDAQNTFLEEHAYTLDKRVPRIFIIKDNSTSILLPFLSETESFN